MRRITLLFLLLPIISMAQPTFEKELNEVEQLIKIGNFEKAFTLRESIYNRFAAQKTYDNEQLAEHLMQLATLGFKSGQYQKSIAFAEQIIALYEGEKIENKLLLARSHQVLGSCYINFEDFEKSLWHTKKALDIANSMTSKDYNLIVRCHIVLGQNYSDLEDFDKAMASYEDAKKVISLYLPDAQDDLATIYFSIGWDYRNQKKFLLAKQNFEEATSIRTRYFGKIHQETAMAAYFVVAMAKRAEQYDAIDSLAAKCLESADFDPNHLEKANNLNDAAMGTIRCVLEKDFTKYNSTKDTTFLNHGLMTYELGKNIPQKGYMKLTRENDKRDWSHYTNLYYKVGAEIAFAKKSPYFDNIAFNMLEKGKSLLLRNGIADDLTTEIPNIPSSYWEKERLLKNEINHWEKVYSLNNQKETATERSKVINQALLRTYTSYDSLIAQIKLRNKDYYDIKYSEKTATPNDIKQLLKDNQAMLSYSIVSDTSLFISLIRKNTFETKRVLLNSSFKGEVNKMVEALKNLYPSNNLFEKATEDYTTSAQALYNLLIAPIAHQLPQSIIIIPDGKLNYIPFEALLTSSPSKIGNFKNYPYLLKKHEIAYSYSATLWQELQLKRKKNNEQQENFIAFAPDFRAIQNNSSEKREILPFLRPLKYNRFEVDEVAATLNGKKMIGIEASKSNFITLAPKYKIIHICTHGKANDTDGDISYLAFQTLTDSLNEALLYVKDIYKLSINAELVTLSACETGIGSLQKGEGIIGLARAFTMIGARSLVATLWSIDDETSKNIMVNFYKNLNAGKLKNEALQLSKLQYIDQVARENTFYASPFYWAAFIPIGNMEKIF